MRNNFRTSKLTLFNEFGHRKYLDDSERSRFIEHVKKLDREHRMFCKILFHTGCRPNEALLLTVGNVCCDEMIISLFNSKKRKVDSKGNAKKPGYRFVPVSEAFIEELDLVFNIRKKSKNKAGLQEKLFPLSRTTYYRSLKDVMKEARIFGEQATNKGLRHSFAISLAKGGVDMNTIRQIMGHTDLETTAIYMKFSIQDSREAVMKALELKQNTSVLRASEFSNRAVAH